MDPDLVARRERTFELLVVQYKRYSEVVETIAREYPVGEKGVESDINRMARWIPDVVESEYATKSGVVRLYELRQARQELHQLAEDLKDEDEDLDKRLRVRSRIDASIELDVKLSQALGLTDRPKAPRSRGR